MCRLTACIWDDLAWPCSCLAGGNGDRQQTKLRVDADRPRARTTGAKGPAAARALAQGDKHLGKLGVVSGRAACSQETPENRVGDLKCIQCGRKDPSRRGASEHVDQCLCQRWPRPRRGACRGPGRLAGFEWPKSLCVVAAGPRRHRPTWPTGDHRADIVLAGVYALAVGEVFSPVPTSGQELLSRRTGVECSQRPCNKSR